MVEWGRDNNTVMAQTNIHTTYTINKETNKHVNFMIIFIKTSHNNIQSTKNQSKTSYCDINIMYACIDVLSTMGT